MKRAVILVFFVASALGQVPPVPYDAINGGPTFKNDKTPHTYRGVFSSIRKVDFNNFDSLRNGHYKHDEPGDHESLDLDSVYYVSPSPSADGGAALVLYSWFAVGGSSSQGRTARVFAVVKGRLLAVQTIDWDTHFDAGQPTASFDPIQNTLVVRAAHYIPGDAHCCVSAMDVITLRWDGMHFVQADVKTELSRYGKDQGKILPR